MNRLLLAPFGCEGATRLLFREAGALVPGNDFSPLCYIAPTPRKMRSAQLEFAQSVAPQTVIAPGFNTINSFVRDAYARLGNRRRLSPELKTLLVARILAGLDGANPTLGYARAVAGFIQLVAEYRPDLEPDALESELARMLTGFDRPRQEALRAVEAMRRYRAVLAEQGWIDDQDIFTEIAGLPNTTRLLPEHCLLLLDGFHDLTRLQEDAIRRMVREAEAVFVLAWELPAGITEPSPTAFIDFIRPLAAFETVRLSRPVPARPAPVCLRFPSREEEVTGIARDIKTRLLDGTLDAAQTLVVFPSFPPYASVVKRVFRKYGVPCTIYPERMLITSPLVVDLLELLNAIENNFPRLAFTAALTSPWFTAISAPTRELVNHLSIRAGILKDRTAWRTLRARLLESHEIDLTARQQEMLPGIQRDINRVLDLCAEYALPAAGRNDLTSWTGRLRRLLHELGFGDALDPNQDEDRDLNGDFRLLNGLFNELEEFEAAFGAQDYRLTDFQRLLRFVVESTPAPPDPAPRGVLVCGTLESRGLDCQRLYYGGLTEAELPSRFKQDPILPDWVRRKLELPHLERHGAWQRLHFLRLVNTPQEAPFLSYPETDEDRMLLPTPFLEHEPVDPEPAKCIYSGEEAQREEGHRQGTRYEAHFRPPDLEQHADVVARLAARYGPDQEQSVTRLERYRRCPTRFYVEQVLAIEAAEEPGFEVAPADWGTIFHRVLERLYAQGAVPLEKIPDRLAEIIPDVLRATGLPGFWQEAMLRVLTEIREDFVAGERKLRDEGFEPIRVERAYRGPVLPDVRVKGRVDRIDAAGRELRVLDYKTGSTMEYSKPAHLVRGTHIQLPLYARLVQDAMPDRTVVNFGVYDLRTMKPKWLVGKDGIEPFYAAALDVVRRSIDAIRRAGFPPQPVKPDDCKKCPCNFICPKGEE